MKTYLITGNDTGVGKTWVVASLARGLAERGWEVQVVKLVETGIGPGEQGDADEARRVCRGLPVTACVLESYLRPLAPLVAARLEGRDFDLDETLRRLGGLPRADIRLIEGAGSAATPLGETGEDWVNVGARLRVDGVALVVEDRLGAIGQGRMLHRYFGDSGLDCGVWLNQLGSVDEATRRSNIESLEALDLPVWARQRRGRREIEWCSECWLKEASP